MSPKDCFTVIRLKKKKKINSFSYLKRQRPMVLETEGIGFCDGKSYLQISN